MPAESLTDGEDGAPLECVAGSIDLVYRDRDGALVVVDFKSDRVASARQRAARAEQYAPQGQVYVRALAEGLGLEAPPRFELWFLRDGSVATPLDCRPGPVRSIPGEQNGMRPSFQDNLRLPARSQSGPAISAFPGMT